MGSFCGNGTVPRSGEVEEGGALLALAADAIERCATHHLDGRIGGPAQEWNQPFGLVQIGAGVGVEGSHRERDRTDLVACRVPLAHGPDEALEAQSVELQIGIDEECDIGLELCCKAFQKR